MGRVVLVTGVSRYLGGRMAALLSQQPGVAEVIAADVVAPGHDIGAARFERADIRDPALAQLLTVAKVDTVVHMGVIATPQQAGGRVPMKEINVIGTMQLLAACQRSSTVRRLIVKSSAGVYGCGPRDPAMFTEEDDPVSPPRSGWARDCVEVEGYVRSFTRRRADVDTTILRFANVIGPRVRTAMTSYLTLPLVPTVLGHDARLQWVQEDDLLAVLIAVSMASDAPATGHRGPRVLNVAGDGVMMLSQCLRRLDRPVIPVPAGFSGVLGRMLRRGGLVDLTADEARFLAYGRGIDTTALRTELGLTLRHTTEEAFESFAVPKRGQVGPHART
ncbi:MAG: NAD-dependent epimerase/dehydratase family protein [Actinomycetales bacterium]|nr:NAD-dependent epimerase/dehydratase family protein [Actinomycetales bacterium]